jgi:GIY-YIG catalytic domain
MTEPRMFHVYALLSPEDRLVHYVGKTFKVADRFKQHVQKAQRSVHNGHPTPSNRRERWLYELALQGYEPILAILEEIPAADPFREVIDPRCSNRAGIRILALFSYPQNTSICRNFRSGRCWVRTSDLLLVREKYGVSRYCRGLQNPHN